MLVGRRKDRQREKQRVRERERERARGASKRERERVTREKRKVLLLQIIRERSTTELRQNFQLIESKNETKA